MSDHFHERLGLKFRDCLGRRTLLYGETSTGKTQITSNFIQHLLEVEEKTPKIISILDLAPPLQHIDQMKIGGRISDYYPPSKVCNYLSPRERIIPPRLEASSRGELHENACHNFKETWHLLEKFRKNHTEILIINDISIHLHVGSLNHLLNVIQKSNTFFGNAYHGSSINKGFARIFSLKEKRKVERLIHIMDCSYQTG